MSIVGNWRKRCALSAVLAVCLAGPVVRAAQSADYRVYVTNERAGTLSVIDGASRKVIATVALGKRPRGLQLSADGTRLFVALSGSPVAGPGVDESQLPPADKGADGIGVVDLKRLVLTRLIRGASDPEQVALSKDGKRLYVASEDTGTAIVLDVAQGKALASVKVGAEPEGVSVSPDGKCVFVTSEGEHSVAIIDTATNALAGTLQVGNRPRFTSFSGDGSRAYVSNENDNSIAIVDPRRPAVTGTIKFDNPLMRPVGTVLSADGSRLFAALGRSGLVVAIDTASGKIVGQVAVGPRPWHLALSPDGAWLFTANGNSNDVSVVDAATLKVETKIPVGEGPWGLVIGRTPRP